MNPSVREVNSKVNQGCHLCMLISEQSFVKVISVRACLCVHTCLSLCDCLGARACVCADCAIESYTKVSEHDCGSLTVHTAFGYA